MKLNHFFFAILSCLVSFTLNAQTDHHMMKSDFDALPEYERTRATSSPATAFITPPGSNVRTIGEWEEIQGLLITWTSYTTMLKEIVRNARLECKVYIVCSNS